LLWNLSVLLIHHIEEIYSNLCFSTIWLRLNFVETGVVLLVFVVRNQGLFKSLNNNTVTFWFVRAAWEQLAYESWLLSFGFFWFLGFLAQGFWVLPLSILHFSLFWAFYLFLFCHWLLLDLWCFLSLVLLSQRHRDAKQIHWISKGFLLLLLLFLLWLIFILVLSWYLLDDNAERVIWFRFLLFTLLWGIYFLLSWNLLGYDAERVAAFMFLLWLSLILCRNLLSDYTKRVTFLNFNFLSLIFILYFFMSFISLDRSRTLFLSWFILFQYFLYKLPWAW